MTMTVPTVKVKHDASPGGHLVINESDFDAAMHECSTNRRRRLPPLPRHRPARHGTRSTVSPRLGARITAPV
jgi:hypothetical protein